MCDVDAEPAARLNFSTNCFRPHRANAYSSTRSRRIRSHLCPTTIGRPPPPPPPPKNKPPSVSAANPANNGCRWCWFWRCLPRPPPATDIDTAERPRRPCRARPLLAAPPTATTDDLLSQPLLRLSSEEDARAARAGAKPATEHCARVLDVHAERERAIEPRPPLSSVMRQAVAVVLLLVLMILVLRGCRDCCCFLQAALIASRFTLGFP